MNKSKIKKCYYSTIIVIGIILFVLPLYINDTGALFSYGPAVNLVYVIATGTIVFAIILMIKNIKNVKIKKYIPLFVLIIGLGIVSIIQKIEPSFTLITSLESFVLFIMYFTIENPDVKMIEQLELAKETAEKANRAKSDFLSSMSHEIRTPLNAIVGLSELMKSNEKCPEFMKDDLTDVVSASETLLEIVGNILDINKIESEKMEIIETPYVFAKELDSLIKVISTRIGEKPIEFVFSIAEDIPYELIGDKAHIKAIISNLLTNAIKYTEKGKISLNVKCINKEETSLLIISVEDTGRGIKSEYINKLFNKFERLDIEKNTTTEGTGLGLAITKRLINMMGGTINVQSNYGQGSLFMAQIPQKIGKMNPSTGLPKMKDFATDLKTIYDNKKILIVDDNNLNLKVTTRFLSNMGFILETCINGKECLEKVREDNKYDLILMDIMMPEMSGETVFSKLKENSWFDTPTIALTADALSGAKERYMNLGFSDYVAKPFSKEQILEKIDKIFK